MIRILSNSYLRAKGATFEFGGLGDDVLAFVYPFSSDRVFTTWFCSPLRILAFADDGTLIFNRVVDKWQLVKLPKTRLILEADPEYSYQGMIEQIENLGLDHWMTQCVSNSRPIHNAGGTPVEDPYGSLLLSLVADAIEQLSYIRASLDGGMPLRNRLDGLPGWRRGQILSAANFVIDVAPVVPYQIPHTAMKLSRNLVANENYGEKSEFLAAAIAGLPWEFEAVCFRCGKKGAWRQVLKSSANIPKASRWRFDRPENHIPLCSNCKEELPLDEPDLMMALAYGYWGSRFDAFHQWVENARSDTLPPKWDLDDYPLWPAAYGGITWATGSGDIRHCAARLGKVVRKKAHIRILHDALKVRSFRPNRLPKDGEFYALLRE